MYAVICAGGKQQKVAPGDTIYVDKVSLEDGAEITYDALLVADGEEIRVGTPVVEGVKVAARVVRQVKGEKIIIFKYKAKKTYRKKQGHRQPYTQVEITAING
jgi:large subunit ribosomal protein L21